jgi:hypothetical protein
MTELYLHYPVHLDGLVFNYAQVLLHQMEKTDRFCGLVVRVSSYRSTGPGSIPGATKFSEKYWVWNGAHSAS